MDGVTWCDLDPASADAVIAAQIERFAGTGRPWEWKHYSYDRPADLPDRLLAAGFTPEPAETLLVAEIADLPLDVPPPPGVELLGGRRRARGRRARARCTTRCSAETTPPWAGPCWPVSRARPATVAAVVALAGRTPISAGRMEFHHGTDFASLWGGGTLPAWRGRGVFRSLVAHRAALAAARGFRYLQVDASPDSRPILKRLGFVELATTTPFIHPGGAG